MERTSYLISYQLGLNLDTFPTPYDPKTTSTSKTIHYFQKVSPKMFLTTFEFCFVHMEFLDKLVGCLKDSFVALNVDACAVKVSEADLKLRESDVREQVGESGLMLLANYSASK